MDDYISREAAIAKFREDAGCDWCIGNDIQTLCESCFTADRIRLIESIHPADVRPVEKGEWIDMGDFEQCSHCTGTHLKEIQTVYGKAIWIKSDFCPNCGADMRPEGGASNGIC